MKQKQPFFISPSSLDFIHLDRTTGTLNIMFKSGQSQSIKVDKRDLDDDDAYIGRVVEWRDAMVFAPAKNTIETTAA